MSNNQTLEQSLNSLPQAEPPALLDNKIMRTVEKLLALESYYKADLLLSTQYANLDIQTRLNLQTGMSALKEQYGKNFEAAYSSFVTQQNATQTHAKLDEPEQGRG